VGLTRGRLRPVYARRRSPPAARARPHHAVEAEKTFPEKVTPWVVLGTALGKLIDTVVKGVSDVPHVAHQIIGWIHLL
jgi:hypothetical protein